MVRRCSQPGEWQFHFELCFSFARVIGIQERAWEVCKHDLYHRHVFYKQLCDASHQGKVDFRPFIQDVVALDASDLTQIMQDFPSGWPQHTSKITQHLAEVVANSSAFELELHRSLA